MKKYTTPEYLGKGEWPIFESPKYKYRRRAAYQYGDVECPFCDKRVLGEQEAFNIGDTCWNCNAEIIGVIEI